MTKRYTRDEFLVELEHRGHIRGKRWHEDWIERGLLDRGTRGRSRGALATWPQEQVELALSLLLHAEKGVQLASLANLVACIWLWWGDAFVPVRQVARALRTWLGGEREPAEKHVRATARELVGKVAHPQGSGKRRLVHALVDFTFQPDASTGDLRDLFDDVFDPDRTGKPRGPAGAELTTDSYIRLIELRKDAREQLGTYSELEYQSARRLYVESRVGYALAQPDYSQHRELGRLYEASDWNEIANAGCSDLLTCLAIVRRTGPPKLGGAAHANLRSPDAQLSAVHPIAPGCQTSLVPALDQGSRWHADTRTGPTLGNRQRRRG